MSEPVIRINGVDLTDAQAMTLQVATEAFITSLSDDGVLGNDDHGREMTKLYRARLSEIQKIMT